MSRIRSIKPEAFRSRSLAEVPIPVRWFYAGLWTEADDLGAGIADCDLLKGALFPKDDDITRDTIEDWLGLLVASKHIFLYEVDDDRYFQIVRFDKHQPASSRRGQGKYPRPEQGSTWQPGMGVEAVAAILASHDLLLRRQSDKGGPIVDERAWLQEAAARRVASHGAEIQVIINRSPGLAPNDVANEILGLGVHLPGTGRLDIAPDTTPRTDARTAKAAIGKARKAAGS